MTTNQARPLEPYNLYATDPVLDDCVRREGGTAAVESLHRFGETVGSAQTVEWGFEANRFVPELLTHDRVGDRIDEVRYHPAYHSLLDLSISEGLHASHYDADPGDGGYVARNARMYMMSQVEVGHCCPVSMTGAVLPALRNQPEIAAEWEPLLRTRSYDPRLIEPADKAGVLVGMGMTERQGGSDVRANTSTAVAVNGGGPGGEYRLTGSKWFTSAPMCDAFLVLAYAPGGLSCFLLPRVLPDGSRNLLSLMRLKDKLGNKSNASAELEFTDAAARLIGDEGRGVRTIIDMVSGTRVDCTIWSVALMRQAVAQAGWHVSQRSAFGAMLTEKPAMQNVLADLEIETEAATLLAMRISGAFERARIDESEAAVARLGAAAGKYWVTKRATPVVREALECVGGNGYVEESILPRLYREAPLNSIWEGAGNVIALDVLRALKRSPSTGDAFVGELERARGDNAVLDNHIDQCAQALSSLDGNEAGARRLVELLALTWQGALLVQHGDSDVAAAFVESRLAGDWGREFGTLAPGSALADISRRAVPTPQSGSF